MSEHDDKPVSGEEQQRRLADAIAGRLDATVPPEVAARLRAARQEAVFIADRRSRRSRLLPLVPVGGAVAAGLAVVLLINDASMQPMPALDEVEMAAAADMELLDELELLAWLDDEVLDAG